MVLHMILASMIDGRGGIAVRAHASHKEGLQFESDSMPRLNVRSMFTQQRMGTWCQYLGDKAARKGTGHTTSHSDGSG